MKETHKKLANQRYSKYSNLVSNFLSCAVLCFLIFSDSYARSAHDDDSDVRTLIDYSTNDEGDKERWFDADQKFTDDEISKESSLLEQQKSFVRKVYQGIENTPESVIALKDLTDNSLTVTQGSLNSIKDNPDIAFLRVDMYEGANLPTMILKGIEFQEKSLDAGNNRKFQETLTALKDSLTVLCEYKTINFADEKYFSDYGKVLSCFNKIISYLDDNSDFAKEFEDFDEFIRLSQKFTNLLYVRYNTQKMLSAIRASLEGIQGISSSENTTVSVNVPLPVAGSTANLDLFADNASYGSTGISFFTVTKTKGAKAGITFNILPAKISGKVSVERASMSLFYSLEAYLDYLNGLSTKKVKNLQTKFSGISGMSGAAEDRKNLQKKEQEALANSGMFEEYMKQFEIIPMSNVSLIWVNVTRAKTSDKAKETTVGSEISSSVSVPLSSLGITLKATTSQKKYQKDVSLLSMLNEDCSVITGLSAESLRSQIGKKYDFSDVIEGPTELLKILNTYNFALGKLATSTSKKDKEHWEKAKHKCEGMLSPKKLIGSRGREGLLKTAILTAAVMREQSKSDIKTVVIFKGIYERLHQLVQLSIFSKNTKGIRKAFHYGTKASAAMGVTAKTRNLTASFSATVPQVGNVSVSAVKKQVEGSPILEENGKYMTVSFSLPVYSGGAIGMAVLREKFSSVFSAASKKKIPINMDDFKSVALSFGITKGITTGGSKVMSALGAPVGVSASGSSAFTFVYKYVDPVDNEVALPGQKKLTREEGQWVMDFVAVTNSMSAGFNASKLGDLPVSAKTSATLGKAGKRTGSDTFHDMSSKFNALSLGKEDSEFGESTATNSLLKGQSGQLLKLFRNIATMKTNAAFELQDIYNKLINQSKTKGERKEYETLFADFIEACKDLYKATNSSDDEEESGETEATELIKEDNSSNEKALDMDQFNKAFGLYKTILEKQFEHIFKPYYDNAFAGVES